MLLIIILFLYLYNPPFLQFNVIHLLLLISIGYLIIKNEDIKETFKITDYWRNYIYSINIVRYR